MSCTELYERVITYCELARAGWETTPRQDLPGDAPKSSLRASIARSEDRQETVLAAGTVVPPMEGNSLCQGSGSDIGAHARHLVQCLHVAFGFKKNTWTHDALTRRFETLDRIAPLDKVLKWFYGLGLSMVTGGEITPGPLSDDPKDWKMAIRLVLGKSGIGRFYRNIVATAQARMRDTQVRRARALSLGQTLLMLKKGTPMLPESRVKDQEVSHREAIGARYAGIHAGHVRGRGREGVKTKREIDFDNRALQEIHRTVLELFKRSSFNLAVALMSFPSLSGHFSCKGKNGGAAALISKAWNKARFDDAGVAPFPTEYKFLTSTGCKLKLKSSLGQEQRFYDWLRKRLAYEKSMRAVPIQIREPFKVRTVTCGEEVTYWVLVCVQKFMWGVLQRHPVFTLIGTPITTEVMDGLLALVDQDVDKGFAWLSGDYSAATDNLRQLFSRKAFDDICSLTGIPGWLRRTGSKALVGHRLYPDREAGSHESWRQWNGQLMGSVLSFPILCILNAVICRMAMGRRSLRGIPLKVNGDDCVFWTNAAGRARWNQIAAGFGMAPSPGKCYFETKWLQMNSELFLMEGKRSQKIPFWNFSHLRKVAAKGGGERESYLALAPLAEAFVFGAFPDTALLAEGESLWKRRDEATKVFIRSHRELLSEAPATCSWFVPQLLGGLGLPMKTSRLERSVRPDHHAMASLLYSDLKAGRIRNPWGKWDLDNTPWVSRALRKIESVETVEIDFTTGDGSWGALSEDYANAWWSDKRNKFDLFSPLLWQHASVESFHQAFQAVKAGLIKRGRALRPDFDWRDDEHLSQLRKHVVSNKWWGVLKEARRLTDRVPFRVFRHPITVTRTFAEVDEIRLRALVPGPRAILASIPAPTIEEYLPPVDICNSIALDRVLSANFGLCDFSDSPRAGGEGLRASRHRLGLKCNCTGVDSWQHIVQPEDEEFLESPAYDQ